MITPEISFILCCSRTNLNYKAISALKNILVKELNWEQIITLSKQHRVASLIYQNILKIDFLKQIIPDGAFEDFRRYYYTTLHDNISRWEELSSILDNFRQHSIEAIPLKGIILADILYHNPGLRPIYADIDILIKENDIGKASEILKSLNYSMSMPKAGIYNILFSSGNRHIELHWNFIVSWLTKIKTNELWQRSTTGLINGKEIRLLSNEDLFWPLLVQIRYELLYSSLFRICDLNELISQKADELDWGYIFKTAQRYHLVNCLCLSLTLCQKLLSTPIPNNILKKLRKAGVKKTILSNLSRQRLAYLIIEGTTHKKAELWNQLLKFLMTDSITDTIKILKHKLTYPQKIKPLQNL